MIDKSLRNYYNRGQLVKPGKGRPGYAGKVDRAIALLEQEKEIAGGTLPPKKEKELQKLYKEKGTLGDVLTKGDPVKNGGEGKEKNILEKLASSFYKGKETISPETEFVSTQRPNMLKSIMSQLAQGYLNKRTMGFGVPAIRLGKDLWTGEKSFRNIPGDIVSSFQEKSPFQKVRMLNLGKNLLSSGKSILPSAGKVLPILGVGAGIAYLHKNRERFTGYATQKGYEDARDLRILEKRRANMLQRKEEGKGYSNKNLGDVTRKIAKKKGLDIDNPNEMKNIDKDIKDIKITDGGMPEGPPSIISKLPAPSTPTGIGGPPSILSRPTPPVTTAKGPPSIISRPPSAPTGTGGPPSIISRPPSAPIRTGGPPSRGGGSPRGGAVSTGAGRNPWGRAYGGRIDKPLTGRRRDI